MKFYCSFDAKCTAGPYETEKALKLHISTKHDLTWKIQVTKNKQVTGM